MRLEISTRLGSSQVWSLNSPRRLVIELHHRADVLRRGEDVHGAPRLFDMLDIVGFGQIGRAVDGDHGAVGLEHPIFHGRGGEDDVQIVLPLQPLLDDLHVEEAQEAQAEAKAQGLAGLRLVDQGGVVELQLFQGILQVGRSRRRWRDRDRQRP